jgi:hypothetical protein
MPGSLDLKSNNSLWRTKPNEIAFLYFPLTYNGTLVIYTLNYDLHGFSGFTQALPPTPGTYFADENLTCGFCMSGDVNSTFATATVTAVSTPEPNTLMLLGAGIIALALVITYRQLIQ